MWPERSLKPEGFVSARGIFSFPSRAELWRGWHFRNLPAKIPTVGAGWGWGVGLAGWLDRWAGGRVGWGGGTRLQSQALLARRLSLFVPPAAAASWLPSSPFSLPGAVRLSSPPSMHACMHASIHPPASALLPSPTQEDGSGAWERTTGKLKANTSSPRAEDKHWSILSNARAAQSGSI